MIKRRFSLPACISVGVLSGCSLFSTARNVTVQPGKGGVVSVFPANDYEARNKAEQLMQGNCGSKKAVIVEEGEVVVGQTSRTYNNNSTSYNNKYDYSYSNGYGSQDVSNKTEWRITYKCE